MKLLKSERRKRRQTPLPTIRLLLLLVSSGVGLVWAEAGHGSLPDAEAFLEKVRDRLRKGDEFQGLYTFRQKETRFELDGQDQVKKSTEKIFEVFPHSNEGLTYRRLVSRNGQPLDPSEIEKQDGKYRQRLSEAARSGGPEGESEGAKRRRRIDEAFELFNFEMEGRQWSDGYQTVVFRFEPKPDVDVEDRELKMLHSCRGKAWFSEADYELVRLEAELVNTVSFGFGIGARFYKGTEISLKRRKVKDDVWMMQESRFRMAARFLLLKSIRMEILNEYSDYQKYDVTTRVGFFPEQGAPAEDGGVDD